MDTGLHDRRGRGKDTERHQHADDDDDALTQRDLHLPTALSAPAAFLGPPDPNIIPSPPTDAALCGAWAEAAHHRHAPLPEHGRVCEGYGRPSTLKHTTENNPKSNIRRPYYKCAPYNSWFTWADVIGIDEGNAPRRATARRPAASASPASTLARGPAGAARSNRRERLELEPGKSLLTAHFCCRGAVTLSMLLSPVHLALLYRPL
ncbi:hypothetical protein B0T24DRAFT_712426 [Lasiosphaeria ovina]|uniref:GRF-like zinc ribbon domain-containing protein n=1 Tax=Lasiosphaeria ovina TaxID=92902 RepID=A0AAE0N0J0_9PEZI|nr:hypothetical protein B0T24DRAFT_712426 [Lasiosphaeria ovina]